MAEQHFTLNGINLNKLKVAELRKELKDRGLPIAGTKTELIDRLMAFVRSKDDISAAGSVDDIDEDDVLNDEEIEDGIDADDFKSVELDISDKTKTKDTESCDSTDTSVKPIKKVVLNRTPSTAEEPIQTTKQSTNGSPPEKKMIKLSQLTAQERLEMRAKKFGTPVSDEAKKLARAERFGSEINSTKQKITLNNGLAPSAEVLQKRAERFGVKAPTVLTKVQKVELLEKRKARFATSGTAKNTYEEQKALRLERFKK